MGRVNTTIYWMNECFYNGYYHTCELSIIIFDIKNEEFDARGKKCDIKVLKNRSHENMHLFEIQGRVSFCKFSFSMTSTAMYTWILEDDHYTWNRRETIILYMTCPSFYQSNVKPVGALNGELIINWCWTKLFAYHLRQRTMRKLEWEGSEDIEKTNSHISNFCIHRNNILPLKNSPNIQIHSCGTSKLTYLLSKLEKHLLLWD